MRKQFTYFMAVLALSTTLIGCGAKDTTPTTPETSVENTETTPEETTETEITEEQVDAEQADTEQKEEVKEEEKAPESAETTQKEESKEDTQKVESKPATSTKPETSAKPQASTKPEATTKPQASAKPQASTKPQAQTKPQASAKPENTTKPEASTKPENTTKPEASTKPEVTSLTAEEVYTKVVAGVDLPATMDLDSELINDMYGIDTSMLKSYKVVAPMMSAHITEIAVFEVKDAADIEKVKAGITKRGGDIDPRHLYPSLQEAYENRQTVVKGNYVFFAMDNNIDALVANFNDAVK